MSSAAIRKKHEEAQQREEALIQVLKNKAAKTSKSASIHKFEVMQTFKARIADFREFAINRPESFESKIKSGRTDRIFEEFIRYCFMKYRVPKVLIGAWTQDIKEPEANRTVRGRSVRLADQMFHRELRERELHYQRPPTEGFLSLATVKLWSILIGQGKSLYKSDLNNCFTKREAHVFINCPYDFNFNEAAVYAIAKTFAQTEGTATKLAKTKIVRFPFSDFVKSAIYFFSKHDELTINEIDDLFDYLWAHRTYVSENGHRFTIAGHTVSSLKKKTNDWHYHLRRVKALGNDKWVGAAIQDIEFEISDSNGQKEIWRFEQICDAKTLAAEGTAMRHCVFSYRDACVNGRSYIFSAKRSVFGHFERRLTIEVANGGTIVQVRGKANRRPTGQEMKAVRTWAEKNALWMSRV
jgi:hypothetical protein